MLIKFTRKQAPVPLDNGRGTGELWLNVTKDNLVAVEPMQDGGHMLVLGLHTIMTFEIEENPIEMPDMVVFLA